MSERTVAAILAGGHGRRLGVRDKNWLSVEGRPIALRQLEILRPLFDDVVVATHDPARYHAVGARAWTDTPPDKGPLGGIATCLARDPAVWWFVVGGDMPFLRQDAITPLLDARARGFDAIVYRGEHGVEPLHAIYHRRLAPRLHRAISDNRLGLRQLLDDPALRVKVLALPSDVSRRFLTNINTERDLERARGSRENLRSEPHPEKG